MFTETGMRIAKIKAALKRSLQVEVSCRNTGSADVTIIDGSALLWTIHWSEQGVVLDNDANFKRPVATYLESSNVYLIFDRYDDFSIRSVARGGRETGVSRIHQLNPRTVLPAQNVVLTVVENKKQLMKIKCNELKRDRLFHVANL